MALMDEVREIIKKSLPLETGETLRKYLDDAECWRQENVSLKHQVEKLLSEGSEYQREIARLKTDLAKAGNLDKRESEVLGREKVLDVTLAQAERNAANAKCEAIFQLASLAFRNPVLKRTEYGNLPIGVDQYGNAKTGSMNKDVKEEIE